MGTLEVSQGHNLGRLLGHLLDFNKDENWATRRNRRRGLRGDSAENVQRSRDHNRVVARPRQQRRQPT